MDGDEYIFEIREAYSPDTIPADRLGEYVTAVARMLGHTSAVHFREVREGSVALAFKIDHEAQPKIAKKVEEILSREADEETRERETEVNEMLRLDNAKGMLLRRPANDAKWIPVELIPFPGKDLPPPPRLGVITQATVIDGELVLVGGTKPHAHVVVEGKQQPQRIDLTRDQAQTLGTMLYRYMRFTGEAKWERNEKGVWNIRDFQLDRWDALSADGLLEAVARLRQIPGSEWGTVDPHKFLNDLRHDNGDLH